MQCPRYHADNREGRRFCSKCAAPLAVVCASCGFTNDPGDDFCGGCAQSLRVGVATATRALSEWTFGGTRARGTQVEVTGCDVFAFRGGKIAVKDSYRKKRMV
jgi:hypothetical protein